MNSTESWLENTKKIITKPKEFFKTMPTSGGYGEPFRYAITNIIITAILSATIISISPNIVVQQLREMNGLDTLTFAIIVIVCTSILGIVGLFTSSAIYHLCLKLVGAKKNYEVTYRIFAYLSVFNILKMGSEQLSGFTKFSKRIGVSPQANRKAACYILRAIARTRSVATKSSGRAQSLGSSVAQNS